MKWYLVLVRILHNYILKVTKDTYLYFKQVRYCKFLMFPLTEKQKWKIEGKYVALIYNSSLYILANVLTNERICLKDSCDKGQTDFEDQRNMSYSSELSKLGIIQIILEILEELKNEQISPYVLCGLFRILCEVSVVGSLGDENSMNLYIKKNVNLVNSLSKTLKYTVDSLKSVLDVNKSNSLITRQVNSQIGQWHWKKCRMAILRI